MIRFRDVSIKTKLISIQLFSTLFVLLFFVGIYLYIQNQNYKSVTLNRMSTLSDLLGSNSVSALMFFDNDAAEEVLASLSTQQDILNATLFDAEGKVFARYISTTDSSFVFAFDTLATRQIKKNEFITLKPVLSDNQTLGWIALRFDTSTHKARLIRTLFQVLGLFLVGLILASLLSLRAQRPISNSIRQLAETMGKIRESGDYSLTLPVTSQDEIGSLVESFNSLLEKVSHQEKHLEEQVRARTIELEAAKTRAEESDHLKSAFLASMSHELRTPLNSIIGFTGILLQGIAGPLTEEQKKQLTMVKNSSAHLLELINDVLDISKIESGRLKVFQEVFKIDIVLIMTISTLRPFAEKKGLTLEYELEPGLPEIHSDKRRVEQILINLINNAIKFTEEGSIRVACFRRDDKLVLEVSDTGIGIKEEDQKFVFHTFRQVDSGLNRVKEGSGLGLAICRRLTELLSGSISLTSTVGVGSTFTVELPLNQETEVTDD